MSDDHGRYGYAIGLLSEVRVNEEILDYLERVEESIAPYGGEWLVHGTSPEVLEGSWRGDVVIIRFPDPAAARSWYDSEEYQAIIPLRTRNATSWVALLEGVPTGYTTAVTARRLSGDR